MQDFFTLYYNIISENVKTLRLKANLSQEQFAELVECSREYVNRLETGKEKISLKMLLKISKEFKIEPYKLLKSL